MNTQFPYSIENNDGEKLTFLGISKEPDGDRLLVENFVSPGIGPVMHTHWLQDECLTVVKGKIGYQVFGQPAQFASEGETVLFKRGVAHRFWNDGGDILHCKGWVKPVNTFPFFISALFAAQKKSGSAKPELFDGAFLIKRYASEYDLTEMPFLVKKVLIPVIYSIGKLLGKYRHFNNAPEPVKK